MEIINTSLLKKHLYQIIPLTCFFFWALLSLIKDNFILDACDYSAFYYAGKYIFTEPELIYTKTSPHFYYLPSFAVIFSLLSWFDYVLSEWIFFFILLIFAWLSIIEFNKILILKNIDKKFNRFLFLMVLSNGITIMQTFDYLQTKILASFLIIFFIRREIELGEHINVKNDTKFQIIQFSILIFALSMIPQFFFFLIIYLFNNTNLKTIFSKSQLKKYGSCILIFIIQNFMFFFYPNLIYGFLAGHSGVHFSFIDFNEFTPDYIEENVNYLPVCSFLNIVHIFYLNINYILISMMIMIFITVFLIFKKEILIEYKFGYFALSSLFFNVYFRMSMFIIVIPLISFLFIILYEKIENYKDFSSKLIYFKYYFLLLLGLSCLSVLYFMPPIYYLYREFPFLKTIPVPLFMLRWTFIYIIMVVDLLFLNFKKLEIDNLDDKN